MEVWDDIEWAKPDGKGGQVIVPRAFQLSREICLTNISDVENFPPGAAQPWPQSRVEREKYLEQFDDFDLLLIGNEIRNKAVLEDEIKNSSPPKATST
jgi:hypothetical protein